MIVLLRHAQTSGSKGRCIGRTAVPLSDKGLEQVNQLTETWRGIEFARLCTSPSQRAIDTVEPLAAMLEVVVERLPELDEIDMGAWDGLPFDSIRERFPHDYAERGRWFGGFRPPGGESFADVADRALPVLVSLAKGPQPVLVSTHAGVIRSVLCRLTDHPMDDLFHFNPGYAHCTVLVPSDNGLELVATDIAPDMVRSFLCSS
ncbi:MAG: histidine phosphatase family protein [Pseudodesulfovibrio sp.]|nr:histidine phosphatase family protein [Pseudodesulfovibrio sp.]